MLWKVISCQIVENEKNLSLTTSNDHRFWRDWTTEIAVLFQVKRWSYGPSQISPPVDQRYITQPACRVALMQLMETTSGTINDIDTSNNKISAWQNFAFIWKLFRVWTSSQVHHCASYSLEIYFAAWGNCALWPYTIKKIIRILTSHHIFTFYEQKIFVAGGNISFTGPQFLCC